MFYGARQLFLLLFAFQRPQQGKENDIADGARIGQQHGQAIDADTFSGGRRQSIRQRPNVTATRMRK
jgi:hypothetical protein